MSIAFVGDIHLGKRLPYSTLASQARFERFRRNTLLDIFDRFPRVVSLGDLYDAPSVALSAFCEGVGYFNKFERVVRGNHDFTQDRTRMAAFDFASSLADRREPGYGYSTVDYFPDQKVFEEMLTLAPTIGPAHVLALHCNYATVVSDKAIENTLTDKLAKQLLDKFSRIICGHEHNFSSAYSGRLIMLGSVVPFTFGEMQDKVIAEVDSVNQITFHSTWKAEEHFRQYSVAQLDFAEPVQFIEIIGEVDADKLRKVAEFTARMLKDEKVFAVKNNTVLRGADKKDKLELSGSNWLDRLYAALDNEDKETLKDYL